MSLSIFHIIWSYVIFGVVICFWAFSMYYFGILLQFKRLYSTKSFKWFTLKWQIHCYSNMNFKKHFKIHCYWTCHFIKHSEIHCYLTKFKLKFFLDDILECFNKNHIKFSNSPAIIYKLIKNQITSNVRFNTPPKCSNLLFSPPEYNSTKSRSSLCKVDYRWNHVDPTDDKKHLVHVWKCTKLLRNLRILITSQIKCLWANPRMKETLTKNQWSTEIAGHYYLLNLITCVQKVT